MICIYIDIFIIIIGNILIIKYLNKEKKIITFTIFMLFCKLCISYYFLENEMYLTDTKNYMIKILDNYKEFDFSIKKSIEIARSLHFGPEYMDILIYKINKSIFTIMLIKNFLIIYSFILFYKISNYYFSKKFSNIYYIILLLTPYFWLFSMYNLKDSYVLFLFSFTLYIIIYKKIKILELFLIILNFPFRIYVGISLLLIFVYKNFLKINKNFFISVFILLGLYFLCLNNSYFLIINRKLFKSLNFDTVIFTLKQLFSFIYSPILVNINQIEFPYSILLIEPFIFTILTPIVIYITIKNFRKKYIILFIPILVHALVLGVEYGGGAVRQKIAIFPIIILFYLRQIYCFFRYVYSIKEKER